MTVYSTEMVQNLKDRYPEAKLSELMNLEEFCEGACYDTSVMNQIHNFLIKGKELYDRQFGIAMVELNATDTKIVSGGSSWNYGFVAGCVGVGLLGAYVVKKVVSATPALQGVAVTSQINKTLGAMNASNSNSK